MEQLNIGSSGIQEEKETTEVAAFERKSESPLLDKVRGKFTVFGGISITFGILFASFFFKASIGLNVMLFTLAIIFLLIVTMKQLSLKVKQGTIYYYAGVLLLGVSTAFTASGILQFLNILGILFLLDLSLLHQFYEDRYWDFLKHFIRMFGLVFQSIAAIGMPFIDCINTMKHTKILKNDKARNIFLGVIISLPFLWMVTALLANADLLFGKLTSNMFDIVFSPDIIVVTFMVVIGFLICYCIICASVTKVRLEEDRPFKKADASIAVTFMTILSLVYAVFCTIQVIYLFADGLFILPDSYTFAEYARRGFFELLAVAIINVSLMVICRSLFTESKLLRLIITCMTVCTYIMIASATYRMLLYIGAYHLTFLRIFVLLSLLIIALILAGVILSVYNQKFPLFRYCVAVISVCYIAFSFSKPDYYVASYLIDNTDLLDSEDILFLTEELSLDAAPVVLPLLSDRSRWTLAPMAEEDNYDRGRDILSDMTPDNVLQNYYQRIKEAAPDHDFRAFDYSKYLAQKCADEYPLNK